MKIRKITFSLILATSMMFSNVVAEAQTCTPLDISSADAGASKALTEYYKQQDSASYRIATALEPLEKIQASVEENTTESAEEGKEILYDEWKIGTVVSEGSLNIRKVTSTLSEVVAQVFHGLEVYVTGEVVVRGAKWYKVNVQGVDGYALARYIEFGKKAKKTLINQALESSTKKGNNLPSGFKIKDKIKNLPEDAKNDIRRNAAEIDFVLKNDYPKAMKTKNYTSQYSILVYLLELYQHVSEICEEYKLNNTYTVISRDLLLIDNARQELKDHSGKTDAQFVKKIQKAQKESEEARLASEEAVRQSLEAESMAETERIEASRAAEMANIGNNIAGFASSFVGKLPYIWGGASLTSGADCSGFCGLVYAHFGLLDGGTASVHGYDSTSLRGVGREVSPAEIQPGDLLCYAGHVAIYYGSGIAVHEPSPGRMAEFGSMNMLPIITVRRLY